MRSLRPCPRRPLASPLSVALMTTLGLASLAGCAPDKGPGSVVVSYVLGNNKSCAELGIERVEVTVYQGSLDEPSVSYEDFKLCADSQFEIEVGELEPGIYQVSVLAFDDAGVAVLDNMGQPETERRVEIFEAAESSIEAELTNRPAQLSIAWRLGEGGFGNCAGVGIDRFEVIAYEVGGASVLLETEMRCDLVGDDEGYRLVADPERELNGVLLGEVGIQPLDVSGNGTGASASFMFEPVGPGYPVDLNIECTVDGCVAQ